MNCMKEWIVADPEHLGGSPRVRGVLAELAQRVPMLPSRGELVTSEHIQQLQDAEGV